MSRGKKWGETTNLHVDARDTEVEASANVRRVELKRTIVVLQRIVCPTAISEGSTNSVVQLPILEMQ